VDLLVVELQELGGDATAIGVELFTSVDRHIKRWLEESLVTPGTPHLTHVSCFLGLW
jgi:hypothetical protein